MLRGIGTGIVLGAAVTIGALKFAQRPRETAGGAPAASQATDMAALRAEVEELRTRNRTAQAEVDAALEAAKVAAAPKEGKKKRNKKSKGPPTWSELAPKISAAFRARGEDDESVDRKELEAAMLGMMSLLGKIAKDRGITVDEAMSAPEGMPQLLLAMLETGKLPPTEEQRNALQALIDRYGADYDGANAQEATRLERRLAMNGVQDSFLEGVRGALSPDQLEQIGGAEVFGQMNFMGGSGSVYHGGPREEIATKFTEQWVKTLKLDPQQGPVVRPIVDEYMAACRDAKARAMAAQQGGDARAATRAWTEEANERLKAQVAAQKKLAALAGTPEQKKALSGWATDYNFNEHDPVPQPELPEESK